MPANNRPTYYYENGQWRLATTDEQRNRPIGEAGFRDPNNPNFVGDPNWRFRGGEWQAGNAAMDQSNTTTNALAPGSAPSTNIPDYPKEIKNQAFWMAALKAGANAGPRENPYSAVAADQSRPAQLALINQMRGQMNGPSLAGLQGQQALAQSGQQALMQGALGGGRSAMLQAQGVSGGLAGDIGQARLGETMQSQASMGGAAGQLRGADLRSAGAQMVAGLTQRGMDDASRRFYAAQGAGLSGAISKLDLEGFKLRERAKLIQNKRESDARDKLINTGANTAAAVAGA